jgi:uncharacterized protein (DUF58 family)
LIDGGHAFDPRILAALQGLDFKARYVVEGFLAGRHASPFHGPSVEFADHRDYQKGDDLRRLDWRLYARSDRLCVKRYRQETNAQVYVLCDTSASMRYGGKRAWAAKLDCARVMAAALAWLLLRQSDAVGLLALDAAAVPEFLRPSQRPTQLGAMLRHLAALRPDGGARLAALLEHAARLVRRRSIIVLLSDLLEPPEDVALALKRLRFDGHECVILQVLDGDEIDFRFAGDFVFEDLETGARRLVDPAAARPAYRERFRAFMSRYEDLFRTIEAHHTIVRTDADPGQALARLLAGRRRRGR